MRANVILVILFIFSNQTYSQVDLSKIDSLSKLIDTQKGRERVETLIHLSEAYNEVSMDKSFETFNQAINYAEQEGVDNMKGIIFLSMGNTASLSGDYPLALDYLKKSVTALENTQNFLVLCKAHIRIGLVYKNMAEFKKAIEHFNLASEVAQKHDIPDQQAASETSLATVYFSMGDFSNAAESYLEAMRIYKNLNDSIMYAVTTMNVGLVYWQWNKSDLALKMMLEAKEVFERKEQYANLGRILNNLGKIYYQDFNDTIQALDYYNQSLELREKTGNQLGMAIVLANIGNIYRDRKQFDLAFSFYERSLNISKVIGYKEGIALAKYYLGVAYNKIGNFKESNRYLDSCHRLANDYGLSAYFSLINEAKMINYAALNNFEAFMDEYRIFTAAGDSIKKELAEMEFVVSESRKSVDDAKAELEKANEKIAVQRKQLIWYRVFLALFLLTGIILASRKYIFKH
ncbi:MAG: tetratricopeptide repeat protein [Bacteroidales bacterium]|nr:tetratricopeptide repeat protein [Bacteroidales bacterium]MDP2235108.1 tetratricopeptide repeat protein [Bacteroidales bacterium]